MSKKEVTIEVKPVAWANDKVTKYQAFGAYKKCRIHGDPKETKEKALDSLKEEFSRWYEFVCELKKQLIKEEEEQA